MLQRVRDTVSEQFGHFLREITDKGETCVQIAANRHRGQHAIELIEALVYLGADINGTDEIGNTALHYAVYYNDLLLATWLCHQPGINVEAKNQDGETPHRMAGIGGVHRMCNFLKDSEDISYDSESSESETIDDEDEELM